MLFALLSFSSVLWADEPQIQPSFRFLIRPEIRSNPDFNDETEDDTIFNVAQGIRVGTTATFSNAVLHASLQDVRNWGTEISHSVSADALAGLHEGYFQIGNPKNAKGEVKSENFWVRVGRQEYALNQGRFFWSASWNPYGRAFDAIRIHGKKGKITGNALMMIWEAPEIITDGNNTINSKGQMAWVISGKFKVNEAFTGSPYLILLRQDATLDDLERDRTVVSPGVLLSGEPVKGFTYEAEGVFQRGQASEDIDHSAWMTAVKAGLEKDSFVVRGGLEVNSGDGDPTDDEDNDFEDFLGARHKYRGAADWVGGKNSMDITLGAGVKTTFKVNFFADYHLFRLQNPTGAWYNFKGDVIGLAPENNTDATIGHEVDLAVNYTPIKGFNFRLGHAFFATDGVGEEIAGPDASNYTYLWMTTTFPAN